MALNSNILNVDQIIGDNEELSALKNSLFISGRNFSTLGAPIRDEDYCDKFICGKVDKIEKLLSKNC